MATYLQQDGSFGPRETAVIPLTIDWLAVVHERPICCLGQIPDDQRRKLDRLAKQGKLIKFQAYWNTMSSQFGLGPLKTWFIAASMVSPDGYLLVNADGQQLAA